MLTEISLTLYNNGNTYTSGRVNCFLAVMNNNPDKKELFSISALARSFGIAENTIRRMESAGLLTPAVVKESGYRYYDYDNISRIKMIMTFRSLGLVYDDMKEYFKSPGDFMPIHNKILEKKIALDTILERLNNYIRPAFPGEISILQHDDIYLFKKVFRTSEPLSVEAMENFAKDTLTEAITKKYPIDYARPISILTECEAFDEFNPYLPQVLTFGIPLRERIETEDTIILPARIVLTFAWYEGVSFDFALASLREYMSKNGFEQSSTVGATFEIGKHLDKDIDNNKFLFHIIIPCRKV